jgi:hypothetical protein
MGVKPWPAYCGFHSPETIRELIAVVKKGQHISRFR